MKRLEPLAKQTMRLLAILQTRYRTPRPEDPTSKAAVDEAHAWATEFPLAGHGDGDLALDYAWRKFEQCEADFKAVAEKGAFLARSAAGLLVAEVGLLAAGKLQWNTWLLASLVSATAAIVLLIYSSRSTERPSLAPIRNTLDPLSKVVDKSQQQWFLATSLHPAVVGGLPTSYWRQRLQGDAVVAIVVALGCLLIAVSLSHGDAGLAAPADAAPARDTAPAAAAGKGVADDPAAGRAGVRYSSRSGPHCLGVGGGGGGGGGGRGGCGD